MKTTLSIPPSLNRIYRTTRSGGMYKISSAKDYETEVFYTLNRWKPLEGKVFLYLTFYFQNERRDIDSGLKVILDSLENRAYLNDRQIVYLRVVKLVDKKNPRVEVEVGLHQPEGSQGQEIQENQQ